MPGPLNAHRRVSAPAGRGVVPPDFDALYRGDPDPFRVATSWYERRKAAIVLACLTRPRYRTAWDTACGTGELAAALAPRCDTVWATDAAAAAADLTGRRTAEAPNVRTSVVALPEHPSGLTRADLVVFSEVLYYLDGPSRRSSATVAAALAGEIVVVNWRALPHDAYLSGDEAVAELDAALITAGWQAAVRHQDREFVVAGWTHPEPGAPLAAAGSKQLESGS